MTLIVHPPILDGPTDAYVFRVTGTRAEVDAYAKWFDEYQRQLRLPKQGEEKMDSDRNLSAEAAKTEAPHDPEQEYADRHTTVAKTHYVISQGISDVIGDTQAIVKQLPPAIRDAVAMQILSGASNRLAFELDAGNEAYKRLTRRNDATASEAPSRDAFPRTRY